jgi:hypothetical protein
MYLRGEAIHLSPPKVGPFKTGASHLSEAPAARGLKLVRVAYSNRPGFGLHFRRLPQRVESRLVAFSVINQDTPNLLTCLGLLDSFAGNLLRFEFKRIESSHRFVPICPHKPSNTELNSPFTCETKEAITILGKLPVRKVNMGKGSQKPEFFGKN